MAAGSDAESLALLGTTTAREPSMSGLIVAEEPAPPPQGKDVAAKVGQTIHCHGPKAIS